MKKAGLDVIIGVLFCLAALLVLGCAGGSKEMLDEDFKKMNNDQLLEYFYRLNDEIEKQEKQSGPSFGIGVGGIGRGVGGGVGVGFHVVGLADLVLDVGHQGVADLADAAVVDGGVLPGQMGEMGVDGDADDFHVALLELGQTMVEGEQLGRADEGEVEGIEEDHRILVLDMGGQAEVFVEVVVAHDGDGGEIGGLLANQNGHDAYLFVMFGGCLG